MRALALLLLLASACKTDGRPSPADGAALGAETSASENAGGDSRAEERDRMVRTQLAARDVSDARVLQAMREVPRHRFVPEDQAEHAYEDRPLPIGHDQTISQPYIVGLMSELAAVRPGDRVLEVGTGSGYQAAVLAELGARVYSIEISEPLGREAAARLERLGYQDVHTRIGDGYRGWPEAAPFDAIVVTAAPPEIPEPLKEQLKVGGRLVVPVGGRMGQVLRVLTRTDEGFHTRDVVPVRFVPMTGEAQSQ